MQMNDENIQTEEVKRAAEPEYKIPEDATETCHAACSTNSDTGSKGGIIMNTPLAVRIECAKGEILNAMETIQKRHALPPCIMDGVLSSVLAEVRSEAKIELINSTNTMMAEKNEELEKAKKAAKRVLKTEPDEEHPEQDEPENPEE